MTRLQKLLLIELLIFGWMPVMTAILHAVMGPLGDFIALGMFVLWCWQFFTFSHYRFCRQEEFLHVLQTTAAAQAPVESALHAYLKDRPQSPAYRFWVGCLLFFVFPGYYWIHKQRAFDVRLRRLANMLDGGASLNQALRLSPGVVSREIALAVAVGQFSGDLPHALHRLPDRRLALQWLEMGPRFLYPLLILNGMLGILTFMMIFIIPKHEKIFLEFKMKLPPITEFLIAASRWFTRYWWIDSILWLGGLMLFNLLIVSSRVRWYFPGVSWVYRMYARGQFLHVLGLMLETGRPLPEILAAVAESRLLPSAIVGRAWRLTRDLEHGEPLADSLVRNGLATGSLRGLIVSAEKAQNLPWALQEMGDSLTRRAARLSYAATMVLFPLSILVCALIVGAVCVAMFEPLVELLNGIAGDR